MDLIQLHTWNDSWLEDSQIAPAIEKLKTTGKVRAVGISLNRWQPWNGVKVVRRGLVDSVRFILSNPDVSTTIPGMRKTRNVEVNLPVSGPGTFSEYAPAYLPADLLAHLRKHRWERKPPPEHLPVK